MKKRRGFVLLMTIALIALATAAMVQFANRSLTVVRRGTIAQHELQQRWSTASCQIAILGRAEEIFKLTEDKAREDGSGWPLPSELSLTVTLDEQPLHVLLRDEQARVNVNRIYQDQPQRLFLVLSHAALTTSAPLRLRPLSEATASSLQRFTSWGQIIDIGRVAPDTSLHWVIAPIADTFTCWGDGATNICRANDDSLRLAVSRILDQLETEELLEARRGYVGAIEELWEDLKYHRRRQLQLGQVLTDESRCYSLEITRQAAERETLTFIVHDPSERSKSPFRVFYW